MLVVAIESKFDSAPYVVALCTGYGALASEITETATTSYAYSGQDQLIGVTPPSSFPSTYAFDGDGLRRKAQERNAEPTTMVWDGSDYLLLRGPSSDQLVMTLDGEIVSCGAYDLLPESLGTWPEEWTSESRERAEA